MVESVALLAAEGASVAQIERVLTEVLGCTRSAAPQPLRRTFLDTFDGRLHRAGLVVELEQLDRHRWLRVRPLGQPAALVQAALEHAAGPVADLAEPRIRRVLDDAAGGRALRPIVTTDGHQATFAATSPDGQAVVRLSLTSGRVVRGAELGAGVPGYVLEPVVTVASLRGHATAFTTFVDTLRRHLGGRPADDPLLRAAAAACVPLGVDPSDRRVAIEPGEPAAAALGRILARHAQVVTANLDGIRQGPDDGFAHDLAATARSARHLIGAAGGVVARADRVELGDRLRELLDVARPAVDADRLLAACRTDPALAPLTELVAAERDDAQRALAGWADGPAAAALLDGLTRLAARLAEAEPGGVEPCGGARPAGSGRSAAPARSAGSAGSAGPGPSAGSGRSAGPAGSGRSGRVAGSGRSAVPASAAAWLASVGPDAVRRLHRAAGRDEPDPDDGVGRASAALERTVDLLDTAAPLLRGAELDAVRRRLARIEASLAECRQAQLVAAAVERLGPQLAGPSPQQLIELGRAGERQQREAECAAAHFARRYRRFARRRGEVIALLGGVGTS